MTHYDYKVVPAPKRARKVKGVKSGEELFALTITDTINEVARQGWEYLRAEHMPAEASRGWLRSAVSAEVTLLVFRRPRESLSPRLAAATDAPAGTTEPRMPAPAERAVIDRMRRREPSVDEAPGEAPTPFRDEPVLRPAPRLGPAD
jgi:hypothetical protein